MNAPVCPYCDKPAALVGGSAIYPHRPDLMGVGYNTDGAWPTDVSGADKTDPVLGPIKAEFTSGFSCGYCLEMSRII